MVFFFFFKQKTAYDMRISDWSSDVCSSDLAASRSRADGPHGREWTRDSLQHSHQIDDREDADPHDVEEVPEHRQAHDAALVGGDQPVPAELDHQDRKSTRLNSSH